MTMAAVDLQNSSEKVIDIALKYGYNSPTAFNRAFKNIHGITPSEAKTKGALIKAFPPISFKITIKGDVEMNYKIEKKDSFRIIGVAQPLYKEIEKNFEIVPQFTWAIFYGEGPMPHSIQELEKRIVTEWLPTSGYEYANGPDIELYLSPDPQNAKFEVWIPVVKKHNN